MSYKTTQKWRHKAKKWLIRYMGGECAVCGYDKYYGNLVTHHVDPTKKEYMVSRLINKCHSWNKILTEADKCVLVCSNCHGEIHAGIIECPDIDARGRKRVLEEIESEKPIPKNGKFHYCPECGGMVSDIQKHCSRKCARKACEKVKWPNNLEELVINSSKLAVAKTLGVSDKAVAKRLKYHT